MACTTACNSFTIGDNFVDVVRLPFWRVAGRIYMLFGALFSAYGIHFSIVSAHKV
jgi:hypothetical protein